MKKALPYFSGIQIGLLRVGFAFWFTALIAFPRFKRLKKSDILPLAYVGLLGNLLPYILFPLAITKLDSGLVGILNSLVPLFTLIFGVFFFGAKVGWRGILGVFVGLVGAIWLLVPRLDSTLQNILFGIFPIIATVFYALSINILKNKLAHLEALTITLLSLFFVGPLATGLLFLGDFFQIMKTEEGAWLGLGFVAILGVVGTSLAVIAFNWLIKETTSLFAASVTYAIPAVALLWGVFDGEDLGWPHVIGMGAILVGIWLVNWRMRRKAREGVE